MDGEAERRRLGRQVGAAVQEALTLRLDAAGQCCARRGASRRLSPPQL